MGKKKVSSVIICVILLACLQAIGCGRDNNPGGTVVNNQTPSASHYTYGNLTQIAGSVTAVTITPNSDASPGARTIYYEGINHGYTKNTTVPQAAGTYAVTFDVAAAEGWNEAIGLSAGTLTVNPAGNAAGSVLIFQAAAPNNNAGNPITYCFVELYNPGTTAVNLSGYSLQYAAGNTHTGGVPNGQDSVWNKIDLTGTIQPGRSFLILGKKTSANANPALDLSSVVPDFEDTDFELSNTSFKIALMSHTNLLTVDNPFDTDGSGAKADGYIDMLGAVNEGNNGIVRGFETEIKEGLRRGRGMRRISLTDTDNNKDDFMYFDYANAVTSDILNTYRPRTHAEGAWDPFPATDDGGLTFEIKIDGSPSLSIPSVINALTSAKIDLSTGNADTIWYLNGVHVKTGASYSLEIKDCLYGGNVLRVVAGNYSKNFPFTVTGL